MEGKRTNRRVDSRRTAAADAILDAAEALFGRHGIDGASLRQIGVAAGSANNSAVQYHFGDKDKLIRAIFERRLPSLEQARLKLLDEAGGEEPAALLRALLLPIAAERDSAGQCSFAAFLLGLRLFGEMKQWSLYADSADVTREIHARLRAGFDQLPDREFNQRLQFSVAVFLIAVVDWDRGLAACPDRSPEAREEFLRSALDYAAAGLCAPYPAG